MHAQLHAQLHAQRDGASATLGDGARKGQAGQPLQQRLLWALRGLPSRWRAQRGVAQRGADLALLAWRPQHVVCRSACTPSLAGSAGKVPRIDGAGVDTDTGAHAHARTHARTHARAHARTHTHTDTHVRVPEHVHHLLQVLQVGQRRGSTGTRGAAWAVQPVRWCEHMSMCQARSQRSNRPRRVGNNHSVQRRPTAAQHAPHAQEKGAVTDGQQRATAHRAACGVWRRACCAPRRGPPPAPGLWPAAQTPSTARRGCWAAG